MFQDGFSKLQRIEAFLLEKNTNVIIRNIIGSVIKAFDTQISDRVTGKVENFNKDI